MQDFLDIIFNADDALLAIVADNTTKAYLILFLIIFAETGLIIFPFLPGDALIFSAGVVAASSEMNIYLLMFLLIVAAIGGNFVNYRFGKLLGHRVQTSDNYFVKKYFMKYIDRTRNFYERHGGMAISIGRFFPVIRTYIPFFAGMVEMKFRLFSNYTVIGAIIWVVIFALPGYLVGEIPWVQQNFGLIFVALIPVMLAPVVYKVIKRYRINRKKRKGV